MGKNYLFSGHPADSRKSNVANVKTVGGRRAAEGGRNPLFGKVLSRQGRTDRLQGKFSTVSGAAARGAGSEDLRMLIGD
jgi:hypothetical protein